jgi:hypothetical protein
MKNRSIIIFLLVLLIPTGLVYAQSSPNYILKSTVVSGGGDYSNSTNYSLISTIGQPSAIGISSSDNYVNHAGFWYTVGLRQMLFLPVILRQ